MDGGESDGDDASVGLIARGASNWCVNEERPAPVTEQLGRRESNIFYSNGGENRLGGAGISYIFFRRSIGMGRATTLLSASVLSTLPPRPLEFSRMPR
ncbi:hypothetical protein KM043_004019 [Ampulex compressa]|nr:hypothetical protein KM043_004019 [Ampulex compressa]